MKNVYSTIRNTILEYKEKKDTAPDYDLYITFANYQISVLNNARIVGSITSDQYMELRGLAYS